MCTVIVYTYGMYPVNQTGTVGSLPLVKLVEDLKLLYPVNQAGRVGSLLLIKLVDVALSC